MNNKGHKENNFFQNYFTSVVGFFLSTIQVDEQTKKAARANVHRGNKTESYKEKDLVFTVNTFL